MFFPLSETEVRSTNAARSAPYLASNEDGGVLPAVYPQVKDSAAAACRLVGQLRTSEPCYGRCTSKYRHILLCHHNPSDVSQQPQRMHVRAACISFSYFCHSPPPPLENAPGCIPNKGDARRTHVLLLKDNTLLGGLVHLTFVCPSFRQ